MTATILDGGSGGISLGLSSSDLISFHNATPTAQRSGAAQAAVATTGSAASTGTVYGYTTAAQADAIVALLNEIRAALVAKGLIAGA